MLPVHLIKERYWTAFRLIWSQVLQIRYLWWFFLILFFWFYNWNSLCFALCHQERGNICILLAQLGNQGTGRFSEVPKASRARENQIGNPNLHPRLVFPAPRGKRTACCYSKNCSFFFPTPFFTIMGESSEENIRIASELCQGAEQL